MPHPCDRQRQTSDKALLANSAALDVLLDLGYVEADFVVVDGQVFTAYRMADGAPTDFDSLREGRLEGKLAAIPKTEVYEKTEVHEED